MALTDIIFGEANSAVAARGNVGVLGDTTADPMSNSVFLVMPSAAQVQSGVAFGQQGTALTGSFTGGGAAGVSRGRVTNA